MIRRIVLCVFLLTLAVTAPAQQQLPTPDQFLGYGMGQQFTPHQRILDYFNELARQSDLVTVRKFGETYEGRPLVLATITSAKNQARIEEIRRNARAIAAGEGDVQALTADAPAIVWLAFGVHGNESSSAEASMYTASALLHEPELSAMLDDLVVIIDPLENPDGRERYIQWYARTRGVTRNENPDAFEHMEPWPGGRYNHYLIDMNRDWTWASQRESRARVAAYQEWMPQVFVDFHEMGAQESYFFPPDAKPINANLPAQLEQWMETFGKANAAQFSSNGWSFFVSERYDLFYPGYGDSWPSLQGAIGMTYEMAGGGRAGLAVERRDKTILTLTDRALRHTTSALTTVRTAAANREALVRYTWNAAHQQIEGGKNTFLLLPGSPNFETLVSMLRSQQIAVDVLSAPATLRATRLDREQAESKTFPAGTAVISTRQARGALANTLLERAPSFSKGFVEEQRSKAEADEPDDFYDLTTWSMPLAMNVEGWVTTSPVTGTKAYTPESRRPFVAARYGYVIDGFDPALYRLAGRLLRDGIRFNVVSSDVTLGTQSVPRGSLIVLKGNNIRDLDARLQKAVEDTGAGVLPLESGWTGGTALGSDKIVHIEEPEIGLIGGPGTDATSFGMLWHTLDVDTPIPHSTLSLESLRTIDLDKYKVLVFPDGNYADRLGEKTVERIKRWATDGGTIVAIKGANSFMRSKDVAISKIKPWEPGKKKDDEAVSDERYNDFRIPGSAFRTSMNNRSYLTFGLPRSPAVLVEGTNAWLPLEHKVDNIITIDAQNPLISGVAWEESLQRVRGAIYVASEPFGKGQIISFADDPNFRMFWRGTLPVFLNAVLYGPSFPR